MDYQHVARLGLARLRPRFGKPAALMRGFSLGGDMIYVDEFAVAERWSISVRTLRKWRLIGKGPKLRKFGSAVRYDLADLEEYEAAAARSSTSEEVQS